jgi:hypothetical protein
VWCDGWAPDSFGDEIRSHVAVEGL